MGEQVPAVKESLDKQGAFEIGVDSSLEGRHF